MTALGKQIYEQALTLEAEERAQIAHQILDSVIDHGDECSEEEAAAAWEIEIEKRVAEIDSGKVIGIPADEFMAEMRRRLA